MSTGIYPVFGKAIMDRLAALLALVLLSPLLLLSIVLIKLTSSGPIFYRQRRVGLHEQPFDILKFRTMTVDPDRVVTQTHGHSPGVTPVGRVLRRLKIDEMPQIINVLSGTMSLVGPRPCMPALLERIEPWARERFSVRPGLTGLAQVNGNIHLDWPDRWRWDVQYVQSASFAMDLSIISRTLRVMLQGEARFRQLPPR